VPATGITQECTHHSGCYEAPTFKCGRSLLVRCNLMFLQVLALRGEHEHSVTYPAPAPAGSQLHHKLLAAAAGAIMHGQFGAAQVNTTDCMYPLTKRPLHAHDSSHGLRGRYMHTGVHGPCYFCQSDTLDSAGLYSIVYAHFCHGIRVLLCCAFACHRSSWRQLVSGRR
jgi:hypothetical protein